jgi:hypothetical protein
MQHFRPAILQVLGNDIIAELDFGLGSLTDYRLPGT